MTDGWDLKKENKEFLEVLYILLNKKSLKDWLKKTDYVINDEIEETYQKLIHKAA